MASSGLWPMFVQKMKWIHEWQGGFHNHDNILQLFNTYDLLTNTINFQSFDTITLKQHNTTSERKFK